MCVFLNAHSCISAGTRRPGYCKAMLAKTFFIEWLDFAVFLEGRFDGLRLSFMVKVGRKPEFKAKWAQTCSCDG